MTADGITQSPRLMPFDFAGVNRAALPHLESLCRRWLPGGRLIGHEWTCGSLRGEAGASCKVNLRTGRWADFASVEKGGDVVSLAAAIHRISQAEAARRLARMFGLDVEGRRELLRKIGLDSRFLSLAAARRQPRVSAQKGPTTMNTNSTHRRSGTMLPAARLWQRTSGKGVPYLAGRRGALRGLVMPRPANGPGSHTHNLLVAEASQREEGGR